MIFAILSLIMKCIDFVFANSILQCSVGCGQGYASREVKCMSGKEILVDQKCSKLVKPIKTRHCSGKTECKWKPDEWKSVSDCWCWHNDRWNWQNIFFSFQTIRNLISVRALVIRNEECYVMTRDWINNRIVVLIRKSRPQRRHALYHRIVSV